MSYFAPTDLAEALAFLATPRARIVAGCTDYFPGRDVAEIDAPLLDITRIDGLGDIAETPDGWRIGAAVTWTDVLNAHLPPAFYGVKLAAREVGSVQIQNRATLVGNICNASPAADGVPPLLTLDAAVEITSATGTRRVALQEFITGPRATGLATGELVTALLIPKVAPDARSSFLKLGSRTHLVISIAMVAVTLQNIAGKISDIRVAVGSSSPVATRLPALERTVSGMTPEEIEMLDVGALDVWSPLAPIDDIRGSAAYRRDAVPALCQRAILQAMRGG